MAAIAIAADEAGAPLKEHLARYLQTHGYEVKDYGNGTELDYPDVAAEVAEAVGRGEHDRALLVCGTGLGMAITANKVPGVRAVTAHDPYSAERARKSSDAQVLTMGARVIAPQGGREGAGPLAGLGVRGRRLDHQGREDEAGGRAPSGRTQARGAVADRGPDPIRPYRLPHSS